MFKKMGLFLTICVFMFSFSIVAVTETSLDPVQIMLVEVLSWEATPRAAFNTVLKNLNSSADVSANLDEAWTLWETNAYTNTDTYDVKGMLTETSMQTALESFAGASSTSKNIFTEAEMVGGYPDISSATGFDTLKASINTDMTGFADNDNGLRFVTLFLRELVRTNYKVTNSATQSVVATYNGSTMNFYLDAGIDTANRQLIIGRVNGLVTMLENFCSSKLLAYAVDSAAQVTSIADSENYVGKFMTYTEEQVKLSEDAASFYSYLLGQGFKDGATDLAIIRRISSGGGSSSSSGNGSTSTSTPIVTATPSATTTPTATPTPTTTPTPEVTESPTPYVDQDPDGPTPAPEYTPKFEDLQDYDWAEKAINYLASKDILKGISETEYAPQDGIKRGDLAMLMVRAFKLTSDSTENFDDVPEDSYYYDECRIGKAAGVLEGVGGNNYDPETIISRQEMMALIVRSLITIGHIEPPADVDLSGYKDGDAVEDYAKPYVKFLSDHGIVIGDQNGNINPEAPINRAEAAIIIYRLYKLNIDGLLD